jgi:hypothetical protein
LKASESGEFQKLTTPCDALRVTSHVCLLGYRISGLDVEPPLSWLRGRGRRFDQSVDGTSTDRVPLRLTGDPE